VSTLATSSSDDQYDPFAALEAKDAAGQPMEDILSEALEEFAADIPVDAEIDVANVPEPPSSDAFDIDMAEVQLESTPLQESEATGIRAQSMDAGPQLNPGEMPQNDNMQRQLDALSRNASVSDYGGLDTYFGTIRDDPGIS